VATSQKELRPDTQIIVLAAGVRVVYFRGLLGQQEKDKVRNVLAGIRGVEILDRNRLDALGCHDNRSGDLIVSPLPGYTMSGAGGKGGIHGRFSEQNPILLFWGKGLAGGTVNSADTSDVVPTLLQLIKIKTAPTVDGKATPK